MDEKETNVNTAAPETTEKAEQKPTPKKPAVKKPPAKGLPSTRSSSRTSQGGVKKSASKSAGAKSASATNKTTAKSTAAPKSAATKTTTASKSTASKSAASKTTTKNTSTKTTTAKTTTAAKSATAKTTTAKTTTAAKRTTAKKTADEVKEPVVTKEIAAADDRKIDADIDTATVETPALIAETEVKETPQEEIAAANAVEEAGKMSVDIESGEKTDDEESLADRARVLSPMRLVFKRFFRSKLSVIGLAMFIALFVFSFLGPVFVPWEETEVDRTGGKTIYTIVEIRCEDENGDPYSVYSVVERTPEVNEHADAGTSSNEDNPRLHLFGTDKDGRDIFVRLMYGGRMSLVLSFLVVLVYTVIGVILGGLAGYFGKWVDQVIMRLVDILNCIPSLPILLIVGAILEGLEVPNNQRIYWLMGFLTLLSWTGVARIVRGQILTLREQEYMVATEALGFSPWRKIFKHLVPNVMPQLIVSMTLGLGSVILTEASLSFLGLSGATDMASWGQMVNSAVRSMDILTYYTWDWLPAGIMIIIAVVSFNFIGDGLRDALDPKMKR